MSKSKELLMDFLVRRLGNKEYIAETVVDDYLANDQKGIELANQVEQLVMPKIADRKLIAHIKDNRITLLESEYIEHGDLIKIDGNKIELYTIPYGGGDEIFIGEYRTIIEAIAGADELT